MSFNVGSPCNASKFVCSDAKKTVRNRVFTIMDRQNFPPAAGLTSEAPETLQKLCVLTLKNLLEIGYLY